MLESNGKKIKQLNNYHMSLMELSQLLEFLKKNYNPKWWVAVITQFALGLRCSELLAINLKDFSDKYQKITYRVAKSNEIRYNEPVPANLSKIIIAYIYHNCHTFRDGYLFYLKGDKRRKTASYSAFWHKWRKGCSKMHNNTQWLDHYQFENGTKRYRIGSHSLRRLHRTIIGDNVKDEFIAKELLGYKDYATYHRYRNSEWIQQNKGDIIKPILDPVIKISVTADHKQRKLMDCI